ncbi:class I SAM-dependent methyltransferase, partial [bacterium]|nr:class I SAM-dependent methyltransferase [bacterium]
YVIIDRKRGQSVPAFLYHKFEDFTTWRFVLPFSKGEKKYKPKITNKIFNKKELPKFKHVIKYVRNYDNYLRNYLVAHNGIKAWEYGLLLTICDSLKDLEILDIGPGPGTFHLLMQEKEGAKVTCLELKTPVCHSTFDELKARSEPLEVKIQDGTMTDMTFVDETFDFVTCISTIEHLHINPDTKGYVSYPEFIEKTHKGLNEICRVLKKGGRLFLTTEVYIPELTGKEIPETYNYSDIEDVFIKDLTGCGMEFIGGHDYDSKKLKDSSDYANYRGR